MLCCVANNIFDITVYWVYIILCTDGDATRGTDAETNKLCMSELTGAG